MHLIARLVVHLGNQMFVGRIQIQMFKVCIQMRIQMHLHLLTSLLFTPATC